MLTSACAVIVSLAGGTFPESPKLSLKEAWFEGHVSSNGIYPTREGVLRNSRDIDRTSLELLRPNYPDLPPQDCSDQLSKAGFRLEDWPDAPRGELWKTSPDGQPAITVQRIRVSRDGTTALVAWSSYWASLASSFHYAFLKRRGSGWRIQHDGTFGPIS